MVNEWEEVSLGDIFNVKHGFAFKGEFFVDEPRNTILVTPGNFAIGGGFQNPKPKYYDGPVPEGYVLTPSQVVVTMTDLSKQADTLGYPALIPDDENTWLHNQRVGLLEFKAEYLCEPTFINYFLRAHNYRSWIIGSASGTTVKHTSPGRIHSYRCKLPPLPEQKAIAHVLGALDDRIELNRRMNETLESMAQALFKSWFVDFDPVIDNALASGKEIPAELSERAADRIALGDKRQPLPAEIRTLFPDEFAESEELGWIPKGWEVGSLADVCFVKGGYAFKSKDFTTSGYPVIKIKNINSERTVNVTDVQHIPKDIANKVENFWLSPGDLLMAMTGATVGKFGLLIPEIEKIYLLNQRVAKFHPIETISKKIWFVYCCLNQKKVIDYIVSVAHGSAQPNVSAGTIMETSILKAGDEVIRVFNSMVDGNFTKMLSNGEAVQTLSKLRDTLLPKLLSGEVRIPNAEKMVEELAL